MPRKVWHKPLHQRKIWKRMSLLSKTIYYMQPFLEHLLTVWQQPLPFPTIVKFMYSCIIAVFILFPIIYPAVVILLCYAALQFLIQRHWGQILPATMDLLGYAQRILNIETTNEKYNLFLMLYLERWRILGTAIASTIDYMRLVLCILIIN